MCARDLSVPRLT